MEGSPTFIENVRLVSVTTSGPVVKVNAISRLSNGAPGKNSAVGPDNEAAKLWVPAARLLMTMLACENAGTKTAAAAMMVWRMFFTPGPYGLPRAGFRMNDNILPVRYSSSVFTRRVARIMGTKTMQRLMITATTGVNQTGRKNGRFVTLRNSGSASSETKTVL